MTEIVAEAIVAADRVEQYIDALNGIVDEAKLHFDDDGITTRAVDPSNVATINPLTLSEAAFESWDSPGSVTIGVNLTRFGEALDNANSDDLVRLAVDMESRKLQVGYRGIEQSRALIDPDSMRNEPDRPDLDLPNTVVVNSDRLHEAIDSVGLVSDHVTFDCDPDAKELKIAGRGDIDEAVVTVNDDHALEGTEVVEDTESFYSIEFIEELVGPIPKSTAVTLRLGGEWPLWMEWSTFDGRLTSEVMLAPRIRSN